MEETYSIIVQIPPTSRLSIVEKLNTLLQWDENEKYWKHPEATHQLIDSIQKVGDVYIQVFCLGCEHMILISEMNSSGMCNSCSEECGCYCRS
tara:strand:- start:180 stop:458 length:279 start_codon:yes stop_codon:yes gene_type:complete